MRALRRQDVQCAERFIHQQQIRMHHQRPSQPDRNACRLTAPLGRHFQPAQPDHINCGLGQIFPLRTHDTSRFQAEFHVFLDRQPRKQAKLWNTIATPSVGPFTAFPATSPRRRSLQQSRYNPQQG